MELVDVEWAVELVDVEWAVELVDVECSVVELLDDEEELELALPVVQCGFCWSDSPWLPPLAWSFDRQPGTLPSLFSVPGPPLPQGPLASP